jgi:hypothetical protein
MKLYRYMSKVEGGNKSSGAKRPESQPQQVPRSGEFLLSTTQSSSKEVTKTDLKLLGYYALLSEVLLGLYPGQMATSVAPIDRTTLQEKVKEADEEGISSPREELPRNMNVNPKWLHRDDRKWPHLAS